MTVALSFNYKKTYQIRSSPLHFPTDPGCFFRTFCRFNGLKTFSCHRILYTIKLVCLQKEKLGYLATFKIMYVLRNRTAILAVNTPKHSDSLIQLVIVKMESQSLAYE